MPSIQDWELIEITPERLGDNEARRSYYKTTTRKPLIPDGSTCMATTSPPLTNSIYLSKVSQKNMTPSRKPASPWAPYEANTAICGRYEPREVLIDTVKPSPFWASSMQYARMNVLSILKIPGKGLSSECEFLRACVLLGGEWFRWIWGAIVHCGVSSSATIPVMLLLFTQSIPRGSFIPTYMT